MRLSAFAAALLLASPCAWSAPDVIDRIDLDAAPVIRLRLTAPVHHVRHYPAERGDVVMVVLETRAPRALGDVPIPDEVRRSRGKGAIPPFTVRASVGAACSAVLGAICLTLRFERAVRYRVGQGEDARSLRIELLP